MIDLTDAISRGRIVGVLCDRSRALHRRRARSLAGRARGRHLFGRRICHRSYVRTRPEHGRHPALRLGLPDLGRIRLDHLVHAFRRHAGFRSGRPGYPGRGTDDRVPGDRNHRHLRRNQPGCLGQAGHLRHDRRRHLRRRDLRHALHGDGRLSGRRHRHLGQRLRRRIHPLRHRVCRRGFHRVAPRQDRPLSDRAGHCA